MEINCAVAKGWSRTTLMGLVSLIVCSVIGACASDVQKSPPSPTDTQVRGHADRAFEKLKQEEQERSAQPPAVR